MSALPSQPIQTQKNSRCDRKYMSYTFKQCEDAGHMYVVEHYSCSITRCVCFVSFYLCIYLFIVICSPDTAVYTPVFPTLPSRLLIETISTPISNALFVLIFNAVKSIVDNVVALFILLLSLYRMLFTIVAILFI